MSDSGDPEQDAARELEREREFWEGGTVTEYTPTDEQAERLARTLFARTAEGRSGFTWPLNGDHARQRDMADARRILIRVLGADFVAKVQADALREAADELGGWGDIQLVYWLTDRADSLSPATTNPEEER